MGIRNGTSHEIHLNLNVRGLSPSATLAINERSAAMQHEGRKVYRMGLGQSPFPVPEPVVEALQANAHRKDYLAVKGLPELRDAVARYHARTQGMTCTGDDIIIGPGSKELMFLLQLVYYGDLVIPTPSWVSYAPQAHILGRHVRWVSTTAKENWRLTPERLDEMASADPGRPRIVILNYPSNPTGGTYPTERLKALAAVARKHRVILLSDEIYGELHHKGKHVSIARFYPEGTIVSSGLSKWCGAGGWRLGTFAFPRSLRWLLDAMAVVASETFTSTSAPIQFAAVRAFHGGPRIEEYLLHSRRVLGALGRCVARKLTDAGVSVIPPEGGFYLFPDFEAHRERLAARGIRTGREFCEALLEETGVAALPGEDFGRPAEELTLRLAYVNFDGSRALAAAMHAQDSRPDAAFLETYCGQLLEGVDSLCRWVAP